MRKSCLIGKALLALLLVHIFSSGTYVHALYYPVYPWTSIPVVTQDEGCIGAGIGDPAREKFDSCFVADRIHDGVDFVRDLSVPNVNNVDTLEIRAVASGTVIFADGTRYCFTRLADCHYGFGNIVVVRRDDGKYEGYPHLETDKVYVKEDTRVSPGTPLGRMGRTGIATGVHLHYVVWNINPRFDLDEPLVNVRYKDTHPSNYHVVDPWTVLTTPDYRLLTIPAGTRTSIRRGPGKKYSSFAKTYDNQTYVAFARVDVTEEDYDLSMTVMRTWYRIDLPCSEESSCAGWIAEDGIADHDLIDTIAKYVSGPACFPIVFMDTNGGGVNMRVNADVASVNPYNAKTGAYQIYGAAGFPVKGDGTTCSCWFPIHRPEFVYTKNQPNAWVCGGTPTYGDWTLPSCNAYFPQSSVVIPQDITLTGKTIAVDIDSIIPPPPDLVPPLPNIPPGASLTVTTRDSPLQMETLVQGSMQVETSHPAVVWLEYGATVASVTETMHRSVSAGSFTETFDIPVLSCGTKVVYRGVAELAGTSVITYGTWKEISSLACPIPPSTTPFPLTVTASCPDGMYPALRISWSDQNATHYDLYIDGTRAKSTPILSAEIYKVSVGTTHTFQVEAYFSNGSSLLSQKLTYALEKNPCTSPVFLSVEMPVLDASDTLVADLLNPLYIQKLGGSATTLEPNVKLRLSTSGYGNTGSVASTVSLVDPALPLVMERTVSVSNLDKSPCYLTTNLNQTFGIVHLVKAAASYCGSNASPSATFHAGDVNSLACGRDLHAAIPTDTFFKEVFLFEPTGRAYIFVNGDVSAYADLPPLWPGTTALSLYCHSERYDGGSVISTSWKVWQEGGGSEKKMESAPAPAVASAPIPAPSPSSLPTADEFHTTSATNTSAGKSLVFSHTCGISDGLLVATVSTAADVERVSSITYNGTPLAPAVGVDQSGRLSQIWYLLKPPTGTHDVTISAQGGDGRIIATAISVTGTWALGTTGTALDRGTTASVTLSTHAHNSLLVDSSVTSFESVTSMPGIGQTVQGNLQGFSGIRHSVSTKIAETAGSHTMSWTLPSDLWGMAAAEFVRR